VSARDDLRVPFGLAVAMAGQPVSLVDECLDEYEAAHRAEVLREAAATIRHHHGGNHSYADLLDTMADGSAT
jgi:hypothetical protein